MMMWLVPQRAPVTAGQMNSVIGQNQQLRMELHQSLLAHRTDAERAQEITKLRDAQVQSDFSAMRVEFEKRQAEWVEKVHVDKENSDAAIHAEQQ